MPLPKPSKKESKKDFISRCVVFLSDKGEFESPGQRVAVCNTQWDKAKAADLASAMTGRCSDCGKESPHEH